MQEGFNEIKAQTSFSLFILDSLDDKCWWNNRRSLFRVTDFLLTLLLIDIAHFTEGLIFEFLSMKFSFVFALVTLRTIEGL